MEGKNPSVRAEYAPITGWKLFVEEKDVTGYIPRSRLLKSMSTRKRYQSGYRGYTYSDWIRKNKWVKALADSKKVRIAVYAAIRKIDFENGIENV